MATKPAKSAGSSKRPDQKKNKPTFTAQDARDLKKKAKRKGLEAGARNSTEAKPQSGKNTKTEKDQRVGSRKPIALVVEKTAKPVAKPKPVEAKPEKKEATPEQQMAKWERELDKLENDDRLNALLDKLELEQTISEEDQTWLDKKLARHQELLKLLGLNEGADSNEDELLQRFIDSEYNPDTYNTRNQNEE